MDALGRISQGRLTDRKGSTTVVSDVLVIEEIIGTIQSGEELSGIIDDNTQMSGSIMPDEVDNEEIIGVIETDEEMDGVIDDKSEISGNLEG